MEDNQNKDHFFNTDNIKKDIEQHTINSGIITTLAQGVKFILQFISTVILTRELSPSDFGLVAMVTSITGFFAIFRDIGLSTSTVQKGRVSHDQISILFWVSLILSLVFMLLVILTAPFLANFFSQPELFWITIAISSTFLFEGLASQHGAILRRKMDFGKISTVEIISLAIGTIAAVVAAFNGAGYWSLVIMLVVVSVIKLILLWMATGWIPSAPKRNVNIKSMITFGINLTGTNLIDYIVRHADYVLIGKFIGAGPLGIYNRAYQLLTISQGQIKAPISGVAISAMSRLKDEPQRYASYYLKIIKYLAWLTIPLTGILAVVVNDLIIFLFGSQWIEVGNVFRIFALAAFLQPVYSSLGWIFVSQGRTGRMGKWMLVTGSVTVISFIAGLPFGIRYVALFYTISFIVFVVPWSFSYVLKEQPIQSIDVIKLIRLPFILGFVTFVMGIGVLSKLSNLDTFYRLSVSLGSTFIVNYLIIMSLKSFRKEVKSIFQLSFFEIKKRLKGIK